MSQLVLLAHFQTGGFKMDKLTACILSVAVGIIVGFLFGLEISDDISNTIFKRITKVTYAEAAQMKADCEATLPRDRFCITELIVREDKQ
jgi:hypothetical protein